MTNLTHVHLRVADLARSRAFYEGRMGFIANGVSEGEARLAVADGGRPILTLTEDRKARAAPAGSAGLFHAALLLPDRASLAHWLRQAIGTGVEFDGFSDHGVSEAIYLSDPDGNGLEFYTDRPRATWPRNGDEIAMFTTALDVRDLMREPAPDVKAPLAPGTAWGHLHLRVTDPARSSGFYKRELGLQVTQSSYPGALFMAADGYHHHLGLNQWGGVSGPRPADALGFVSATFALTGASVQRTLADPDGIAIVVETK